MKTISYLGLFLLAIGISIGFTNEAYAQDDPSILLKIVQRTQDQIQNQISIDSSDKIKDLFEKGNNQILSLENALHENDTESAKKYFLSVMQTFKEISSSLDSNDVSTEPESVSKEIKNLSGNLVRLHVHVENLKRITDNHRVSIDFSQLDELFVQAKQSIADNQIPKTLEIIEKIKTNISDVKLQLHEHAITHESTRAKDYAQKYIEKVNRLIEQAKKQSISTEIIEKLEKSRENLSLAKNPDEIIKEIRNIVSIKDQFDLTQNDIFESRILTIEKILDKMSQIKEINTDELIEIKKSLKDVKYYLYEGELSLVEELLQSITAKIQNLKSSI